MPGPGAKSSKKKKTAIVKPATASTRSTETTPAENATPKTYTASEMLKLTDIARLDGWEEGHREGLASAAAEGHGDGLCVPIKLYWIASMRDCVVCIPAGTQTEPETTTHTETSSQTTPTATADAVTQTAAYDETPTSPPSPPQCATSSLTTPAQPPSTTPTTSTTTTTTSPPASKRPPTPCECRRWLPGQPTPLQPTPQPCLSHSELAVATATSPAITATMLPATTAETATMAVSSTQTATDTLETINEAVNKIQGLPMAEETNSRDDEQLHSSKRAVCSTDEPHQPHLPQQQLVPSPTHPWHPQFASQSSVEHLEPPSAAATSYSTTPVLLAPPPSERDPGLSERRNTPPEPSEHPRNASQPPCSLQNSRKRAASPSPVWYTPPASPTTPSAPAEAPRSPPTHCSPPIRPSSPQLDHKQAVLPPLGRFDWAEDAASMPITPSSYPRDLSGLKTGHLQPFGTLRRRTRRRRPRHLFLHPQQTLPSPYVYPSSPQPFITRRHPSGIGPGKLTVTVPLGGVPAPVPPVPRLDWDQDPRLVNLSQALRALGWIPPC